MVESADGFSGVDPASSMPCWYPELLGSVSRHVSVGQRRAVSVANQELVLTYWQVGREILERRTFECCGTQVVNRLSGDLKRRVPDATGLSPRNLRYMRAFAGAWPPSEILRGSLAQLPWYHQVALLHKLADREARLWYAGQSIEQGWSRDVLALQVETELPDRLGQVINNSTDTLPPERSDLVQHATKDPYRFDFLGTTEPMLERDLERKLLEHMSELLLELGQGFDLVRRQVRLTPSGDEFWCDLLFYYLGLRCYLVFELKAVPFKANFLGQLGLYISAFDALLARPRDKPTVGLLLCETKNAVVAEYALRSQKAPVGVADWAAPFTESHPSELSVSLPSNETLEAELSTSPDEDV